MLIALVAVLSACEKSKMPDAEAGEYYVKMTVNGEQVEYRSGIRAIFTSVPGRLMGVSNKLMSAQTGSLRAESDAPIKYDDSERFDLNVDGTGGIEGKYAFYVSGKLHKGPWELKKIYQNLFTVAETAVGPDEARVDMHYLTEELSNQYLGLTNDVFTNGSAKITIKEATTTYFKGTFQGVLSRVTLPYQTELGNVALEKPLLVVGEFYVPNKW